MPLHNADIAAIFEEIADLLEIKGENPFRIRAYRNAARSIAGFGQDIRSLFDRGGELPKLPGIGADLDAKVHEIAATGSCALLDRLRKGFPPAITGLLKIPGLGPKRVKVLHAELQVRTIDELRQAARAGRVRDVAGFGEKTERHILQSLEAHADASRRFKLAVATQYAEALIAYLKKVPGVKQAIVAGSFRRMRETVGDLDILITAGSGSAAMEKFCAYDEVKEVLSRGETRASVVLKSGLQVDLRLVPVQSYGAALHYFTGSKAHNIAVRRLAQERGLKLNEYGVFRGAQRIAGDTEESVFKSVGMPYIPPELREDRGEIEAARSGHLPQPVTLQDIKGDLHVHTRASDGHDTVRQMAVAAKASGLGYIAITEHSRRLTVAHGLDPRRLARQIDEIDRLNEELADFTILKGIEVDILEDGSLDLPDPVLARLDLVIGAVHSAFDLPRRKQTERILRAMDHRCFTLFAHPTGRLIGSREPYEVDMLKILRAAKNRGCFLELNAQPDRLDLQDTHCQMARDEGVLVCINSDAHSTLDFACLKYGIGQARRGWLEPGDVLNTRVLAALKPLLRRTMRR
ncbi:MAG TPA: DNA polymerase/3'-5' exonuclease PolX [Burkholderiales bacterium]|nr:DNA polymerase/3'-5' exonuclease PolX [Burkholderiales bacterium]